MDIISMSLYFSQFNACRQMDVLAYNLFTSAGQMTGPR
jgi:hypothetical protein